MGHSGNRNGGRRRFCSQCGARIEPGDRFCSDCGARQDDPRSEDGRSGTGTASVADREYDAFRRRVRDRLNAGWEIEYDGGDYVVLVDREFGSLWWHAFFLIFTGGVGNLLYAWYKYSVDADRLHLSAGDETAPRERAPPEGAPAADDGGSAIGWYLAGIFLAGIGAAAIASSLTNPPGLAFGAAMLLAGLFLLPPIRQRLRNRHQVTAFGPTKTVDERVVSNTDRPCGQCFSQVDRGVVREYREEYAVAGLPLYTIESGENYYCEDCIAERRRAVADVGTGYSADDSAASTGDSNPTLDDLDVDLDDEDATLDELDASDDNREFEQENA